MTSGSIAYAVSNPEEHYSKYILFIPIIIGFFFLIILFYGSILIRKLGTDMKKMTEEINVDSSPNTVVLVMFFYLAALIYLLISIGIVVLLL
jgi:hypothetical protein